MGWDCDNFHIIYAVQPKELNDSFATFANSGLTIPTQFGEKTIEYSLNGHKITTEQKRVLSTREGNMGAELGLTLKYHDIDM